MPKKKRAKPGQNKAAVASRLSKFIEVYLSNNQNGTDAAISAGFSPRTAASQASRLLRNVKVQEKLNARRQELLDKFELNTDAVLRELARISYFDLGKCFDDKGAVKSISKIDDHTRRAIASYRAATETLPAEVTAFNKVAGLRTAMQHLRLLPHRGITLTGASQSMAAAEVSATEPEQKSVLEMGRRVAFALVLAGEANQEVLDAPPEPAKPTAKKKRQPA